MTWYERIIACHTLVTDKVAHGHSMQEERYFVWREDSRNDFIVGDRHTEKVMEGTTDLYTKQEFDPWVAQFEMALDLDGTIAWYQNSIQYEDETGYWHYEWVWQVPMGV